MTEEKKCGHKKTRSNPVSFATKMEHYSVVDPDLDSSRICKVFQDGSEIFLLENDPDPDPIYKDIYL
jgi:hypothetical protein